MVKQGIYVTDVLVGQDHFCAYICPPLGQALYWLTTLHFSFLPMKTSRQRLKYFIQMFQCSDEIDVWFSNGLLTLYVPYLVCFSACTYLSSVLVQAVAGMCMY